MLTAYLEDGIILRSLTAGAKGYLVKDVDVSGIKRTIRAVARGQSVLDPKVTARVIANATAPSGTPVPRLATTLSESDLAIVRHMAKGLTNKEIAALVHLSPHTIKDRLEKIAGALEARSRTGIVAEAMRTGLI